ncbi:hypothetical protein M9458_057641 [Cirrhinus mrigala]|uniref:DDE Tnp4 domain-containing protein n=1 Tax=Cirrhinus mrigala TaxID=683832 RepID=A0ABD0MED7_CIRMR
MGGFLVSDTFKVMVLSKKIVFIYLFVRVIIELLLAPLTNPQTDRERRYNDAHSRTRSVEEWVIGQLKCRWRCLDRTRGMLLYHPNEVCRIVLACGVLHNVTHRHGIPLGEVVAPAPDDPDPEPV